MLSPGRAEGTVLSPSGLKPLRLSSSLQAGRQGQAWGIGSEHKLVQLPPELGCFPAPTCFPAPAPQAS